ncbi:hypothetical protein A0H81_04771 [Grifola frondosa]|uniref:Uncharacterized protein n=1 Tax=Grifola frondosa TaxID=5627 RepID=A0A1C7MHM1_GRIFR|nr:hypothetical protein A0H81_04771 [Grifola frondosa]
MRMLLTNKARVCTRTTSFAGREVVVSEKQPCFIRRLGIMCILLGVEKPWEGDSCLLAHTWTTNRHSRFTLL